jgi:NitT/TauT family transport system substrate-binding protein
MIRISVCLFVIFYLAGCTTEPEKPLRIITNTWPGYEPLYWAAHQDYFPKNKFRLIEAPSATEVLRSFRNGLVEGAALTLDEVILLARQGFDPKIVLLTDYSNGADVIIGKKWIKTIADLKGKKVGVENSALGGYLLTRALQINKISEKEITKVYMEYDKHVDAFAKGPVDAIVTFEPARGKILRMGGTILFDSSQIPHEILDVVIFSAQAVKNHPGAIKALSIAWEKSVKDINNPTLKEPLHFMAQREQTSVDLIVESLKLITLGNPEENASLVTSNPVIKDRLHKLNIYMKEAGLLNQPISELGLFIE